MQGKYKVYIIDEVHMMSTGAFNALLKTLEDPPEHIIFILATTEPHKILPTIISRCQRFDFTRLTDQEMIDRMKTVMKEENKTYDEGALALIAKLANGGMRDALSILEQCLAYNDDHLSEKDVNSIYGIVSLDDKINLIKVILAQDMNTALSLIEKMDTSGIDVKRLTYDLIDILKDVIIYKNTQNIDILSVLSSSYIDSIVPYIASDDALSMIDVLLNASEKFARSVNPEVYFELAILKLCNQDQGSTAEKVIAKKEIQVVPEVKQVEPVVKAEPITEQTQNKKEEPKPKSETHEIQQHEKTSENKKRDVPKPEFQHERKEDVESIDENIKVGPDDIMNILVQADRHILNHAKETWPVIKRYMANMNTAKAAGMLCQGEPVAACKGGLIIAFKFMPDVNAVNYYKNYNQLSSLLKEVFGEEYKFIGMLWDDWQNMRNHFIKLYREHKLPKPGPIVLKHIESHDLNTKKLTDAQQYAIDMFESDIVEFSEDD